MVHHCKKGCNAVILCQRRHQLFPGCQISGGLIGQSSRARMREPVDHHDNFHYEDHIDSM